MPFTRKRVYAGKPSKRIFKKRRFIRRRGKKATSFTSQSGTGSSLRYVAKKLSRRRWNSKLWNDTLAKPHYRSSAAITDSLTTPASATIAQFNVRQALDNDTARFYETTGGLSLLDTGMTLPTFKGDFVLRGGKVGINFVNSDNTVLFGKVWLVKAPKNPNLSPFPITTVYGADPSEIPEFTNYVGKIKYSKEFTLEALNSIEIVRRIPIFKKGIYEWANIQDGRYYWIFTVTSGDATANTYRVTRYFNVSFSADAIT